MDVWPDVWPAVEVFAAMGTQWRMGPSGPIGLDYGAIPAVLRLMRVGRDEWAGLFDDLRVIERAALEEMHKD